VSDLQGPKLVVYNPDLLSDVDLARLFVARLGLLERLLEDLREEGGTQHHLLLGQRGMGKTTVLRRLAGAISVDEQLSAHWLPLSFPEEQYNVARLSDLWTNCLDALGDALEREGDSDSADAIDTLVSALPVGDEESRAQAALTALLDWSEQHRGLVLLVDNVELLFDRLSKDHWRIREVLGEHERLVFVAASTRPPEQTSEYGEAFYDFFCVHELRGLDLDESRGVVLRLAEIHGHDHVARVLDEQPSRFRALHTLTGGNPRTLVLLYQVLAHDDAVEVQVDLERLLDLCTPLYKARFEALPIQSQQVVNALALNWDPCTANDLARLAQMDVNKVSSQLARLQRGGVVEKVRLHSSKRNGFQIGERFFNIWYLMRASRRVRRKLLWLVRFLETLYGSEGLTVQARRLMDSTVTEDPDRCRREAEVPRNGAVLGCLLLGRDCWEEAVTAFSPYLQVQWDNGETAVDEVCSRFIFGAVSLGRAEGMAGVLESIGLHERWRPLHEALRAAAAGTAQHLLDVAPEIRGPARQIYDAFVKVPPTPRRA
jgi:hypothetical protein